MTTGTPTSEQIQLWYHYEEIAMHFNGLLIQFRLQLLGGGVIGTLIAHFIAIPKDKDQRTEPERYSFRTFLSWVIFFFFLCAAAIDLGYYNQLLRGAVNELLRFEKLNPAIQMSTEIERTVQPWGYRAIWSAYIGVAVILLVLACHSTWVSRKHRKG